MGIDKPNDNVKKTDIQVVFKDGSIARGITDVWVRQGGLWVNIIPPDRLYAVKGIKIE